MTSHTLGNPLEAAPDVPITHDFVEQTVDEVARLENRSRVALGAGDRFSDIATAFSGSVLFVMLHAVWFAGWISVNTLPGVPHFDPFPFGFLTLIVSLEAIFLSTFVLISQNRQALAADRRAKVDLQVNVIAEQEVTKLLQLVTELHEWLRIDRPSDPVLEQMRSRTYISDLADAVEAEDGTQPVRRGPRSAAENGGVR